MKRLIIPLLALLLIGICLAAISAAPQTEPGGDVLELSNAAPTPLPDLGPAPELENEGWLNTDAPLRLADLRGKVVGLAMWTFGCINCQHVIPSLRGWYATYKDQGLVIIGNHFPEFGFERDLESLKGAVAEANIKYPVAQDNEG